MEDLRKKTNKCCYSLTKGHSVRIRIAECVTVYCYVSHAGYVTEMTPSTYRHWA